MISLCTMHFKLKRSKELKLKKGLSKCNSDGFRFKGGECKLGATSDFSGWFQCKFCVPLERYQQILKYSWQRLEAWLRILKFSLSYGSYYTTST